VGFLGVCFCGVVLGFFLGCGLSFFFLVWCFFGLFLFWVLFFLFWGGVFVFGGFLVGVFFVWGLVLLVFCGVFVVVFGGVVFVCVGGCGVFPPWGRRLSSFTTEEQGGLPEKKKE